nr:PREDICTED: uncharacterized protein LOC109033222 [Bemisia tabaci]
MSMKITHIITILKNCCREESGQTALVSISVNVSGRSPAAALRANTGCIPLIEFAKKVQSKQNEPADSSLDRRGSWTNASVLYFVPCPAILACGRTNRSSKMLDVWYTAQLKALLAVSKLQTSLIDETPALIHTLLTY